MAEIYFEGHDNEYLWSERISIDGPVIGSITRFIRERSLLPFAEIDAIIADAPVDLIDFQRVAAEIPLAERPKMRDWIERFNAGVERLAA